MTQAKSHRGFSIIELLGVIAIVALLGGVALVAQAELRSRARLGEALTTFETELERVRRLSKAEDRTVDFQVSQIGDEWAIVADGKTTPLLADFSNPVGLSFLPPYGTLDLSSAVGTSVTVSAGHRSVGVTVVGILARAVISR